MYITKSWGQYYAPVCYKHVAFCVDKENINVIYISQNEEKIWMSEQTFFDHLLKLHRRQLIGMVIYITTSQKTFLFMCGQRKYMCYIHITTRRDK